MNIGELTATLGIDSRGFDSKIKAVTGQLFSLKSLIVTVAGGYGLKKLSGSFLDAAREAENYRLRLNALLGSTKEGTRLFKEMSDYAAKVPFQYRDIMSSATQLAGVMKGGVDEVKSWMPLIGDLAAASGLGIQKTTEQIIRMYSAGAASADLFRERGILAMLGFQAGVSYSADETRKKLIEAWLDPQSKFRGLTEEMANTWDGLTSMMSDKWFQFRNDLMEAGTFDFLKAGLKMVDDYLNNLRKTGQFDAFAKDMGETITKGFEWIIKGAALVSDAFRGWQMILDGLKLTFASFSMGVMKGFEGILFVVRKLYEWELKALELLDKIPFVNMDYSGVLTGTRLMIQDLNEMSNSVKEMGQYWAGVLEKTDAHLEQLATGASNYKQAKKLIDDIRSEMEKMAIRTPGGEKGIISDDIYQFTSEAADNAKKKIKEIGEVTEKTFGEEMVDSINNWSGSFSSMLNQMAWGADVTFKDIGRSFGMMITEMYLKKQLVEPWMGGFSNWFGGLFGTTATPNMVYGHPGAALAWAKGGVFENNHILKYGRGGFIDRPTIFSMQNGAVMAGEAGDEVIMPVRRMPGGDMGVKAQGGGNVTYNVYNNIYAWDSLSLADFVKRNSQIFMLPVQEAREMGAKI